MTIARSSPSIAVDDLLGLLLGLRQPARGDVGGRHARRVVDHQDEPLALAGRPLDPRPGQGQHRQQHGQELEEQQQVPPQPLEQAVDVQVLQAPPPEQGAGHLHRPAPQLEEVQRDDPDRHARQHRPRRQPQRRGELDREAHRTPADREIPVIARWPPVRVVRAPARDPRRRAARPSACGSSCRADRPRRAPTTPKKTSGFVIVQRFHGASPRHAAGAVRRPIRHSQLSADHLTSPRSRR